jgi:hypothetical protein
MKDVHSLRLIAKARRVYRRARAKNSDLPALVRGKGVVKSNGVTRILLPAVDGKIVSLVAPSSPAWSMLLMGMPSGKAVSVPAPAITTIANIAA